VTVALSGWWIVGWAVGVLVVVIAATLVLAVIALARRIVGQADAITEALDGARENTTPLFDVKRTNLAVDRITRGLRRVREGGP
jgi:hypothetical protein